MSFESDFSWQRKFIPEIKRVLGEHLIGEAPAEEDMEHNTDLVVLRLEAVRVACRIRRNDKIAKYGSQFTIRTSRPSGRQTELAKVLSGWGDYIFYGFGSATDDFLCRWLLGDLKVFRLWHANELARTKQKPGIAKSNHDGSSDFAAYEIANLPADFMVADYDNSWAVA